MRLTGEKRYAPAAISLIVDPVALLIVLPSRSHW